VSNADLESSVILVFTDSDLLLKHAASTNSAWPTGPSARPVGHNTDISTSGNNYATADIIIQHENNPAVGQLSSTGYCTAPAAQHLFQHSTSYPLDAGRLCLYCDKYKPARYTAFIVCWCLRAAVNLPACLLVAQEWHFATAKIVLPEQWKV